MRLPFLPVIIWILINCGIDLYIYKTIEFRLPSKKRLRYGYAIFSLLCLALIVVGLCLPFRSGEDSVLRALNWILFTYLTIYVPKYVFFILDLIARIPQIFRCRRWKWVSRCGVGLAIVLFATFWWGTLINRYKLQIKDVTVEIAGLPKGFDGYRIVQFSDFHVGTYGEDTSFVRKVVTVINDFHPDAIFFTGDIVNRHTSELEPFVEPLSELHSPTGVKAILGNHDYGDYYNWPSKEDKTANMQELYSLFDKMGWRLLRNETDWLVEGQDSIAVIGVENIGDAPFPVYGSLEKAYSSLNDDKIKILLTHNPAHWVDSISNNADKNVQLTLSGHTHGMQMTFGNWSPASLRYKTWGGLYEDSEKLHQLYVNIGLGTVGLPMRIGATPEITLITLRRQKVDSKK